MAFAFSVAGEAETDRLIAGAIVALTVTVTKGPPAVGQPIEQTLAGGVTPAVADGIASAAEAQLVAQAQRAVPGEGYVPLLFAGAALPVVVPRQRSLPGFAALALEPHAATAHGFTR